MLRIVPHTVPRVGCSYEYFPDGFELHLLRYVRTQRGTGGLQQAASQSLGLEISKKQKVKAEARVGEIPTFLD
jgi:hypothetical protein